MRLYTHAKIALTFTTIMVLTLSVIFFYIHKNLKNHAYENMRADLVRKTDFSRYSLESMSADDVAAEGYDRIADQIGKTLKVRATIIASDGKILGDSDLDGRALSKIEPLGDQPEILAALKTGSGEIRRYDPMVNQDLLYAAMRFKGLGTDGIIRLAIPISEIEQATVRLNGILAASLLGTFLLAFFIKGLASVFILKPIRKITEKANSIANGDFSNIHTTALFDEIGDLAKAFNAMSRHFKGRMEEIDLSRSRIEAVLLNMCEGVLVVDVNGAILLMNPALRDFFHIRSKVEGKNAIEVIRNIEIPAIIDRALKESSRLEPCEISALTPEEKVLSVYATPVFKNESREGAILVFHDNTNVRRLEKIRQDFVANVSHELKTPITSIKGYAETLLEGALDDRAHALDFTKTIHAEAERLANLVNDLLNLSKIESGKLNMDIKAAALAPIVLRVVRSMKGQAENKFMSLITELPDYLPLVLADETRLTQVLYNLIDNAIKYTPERGAIHISAADQGGQVAVRVSDNGIGIPDEEQSRIFERFYRVDKGRSRALGGTGLGLSIVKHIIKAHNGDIFVESVLGKGAAFTFTLPKTGSSP